MIFADRFSRGLTERQLKAIRSHDRPEADADLPSCDEIASMPSVDIREIAINARRRVHEVVIPHVRFLRIHAVRAAAVVANLEGALRMADPYLVCEEDRFSDGRDIDPFGVLGEKMFNNIELALEQARCLSGKWNLRVKIAGMRRHGLEQLVITCTEKLGEEFLPKCREG